MLVEIPDPQIPGMRVGHRAPICRDSRLDAFLLSAFGLEVDTEAEDTIGVGLLLLAQRRPEDRSDSDPHQGRAHGNDDRAAA